MAMVLFGGGRVNANETGLVAHWLFESGQGEGNQIKPMAGSVPVQVEGRMRFRKDLPLESLLIDRDANRVSVPYDLSSPVLPKKAISVSAWVSFEKTVEWGGIISATKQNKGWVLGARQSTFSFGVSGKDVGGMTHLRGKSGLEWGRWYHVVGTYDGAMQRIYVDGKLEGTADRQVGEIDYASDAPFVIGAFENFFPRCSIHEARIYERALTGADIEAEYQAKTAAFPPLFKAAVGPVVERIDHQTIKVKWETAEPEASHLAFGSELPLEMVISDGKMTRVHEVTIDGIERDRMYFYRIRSGDGETPTRFSRLFEFDSTFDYTPVRVTVGDRPFPQDELTGVYETMAERALAELGETKGYCLVLGCGQGRLAYEIAKRSGLQVIGIDEDEANVAAARKALDAAGVYGVQVTVHHGSLFKLPYADYHANLIVSDQMLVSGTLPGTAKEVFRVLRPCGGVAYLGQSAKAGKQLSRSALVKWLSPAGIPNVKISDEDGTWLSVHRDALPGAGDWSHQYADATNASNSQDTNLKGAMQVLWFGRPGPRPMLDRGTRSPSPLSTNGRLFIQGDRRLFGLDAYNGTILWTLEAPDLRRANVPRDSSNMVAATDALYVTVGDKCWKLDPATGERTAAFRVPQSEGESTHDWGYVGLNGNSLIGSAVKRGGIYLGADGEWYDKADEESRKVVSDYLYTMDRETGDVQWMYTGGLIINPTICTGDGRFYFVECRNPKAKEIQAGRAGEELRKDLYLVALDGESGKKVWERPQDFNEGRWVFYLSYANETLIALSTSKQYHLYAFRAKDGEPMWQQSYAMHRDHHGGAMQHPTVVGNVVFAEPKAFDLKTGTILDIKLPNRGGCGAFSAAANSMFFRDGYHTMWDLERNTRQKFTGIRPGCWLGVIPAGGVLLAPETSAGCHCANPIQTSIAFTPKPVEGS
jgi:outer membrane protein assembly factor BamB